MNAWQILALVNADRRLSGVIAGSKERTPYGAVVAMHRMHGVDYGPIIDALIAPQGWYRTREAVGADGAIQYFLEAIDQPVVRIPRKLFHATRAPRDQVIARGLVLSPTNNTWTGRRYNSARLHLSRSVSDALTYVESAVTGRPAIGGLSQEGAAQIADWDVYEVDAGEGPYYADVEMEGAVWTTQPASTDRLRLLSPLHIKLIGGLGFLCRGQWSAAKVTAFRLAGSSAGANSNDLPQ